MSTITSHRDRGGRALTAVRLLGALVLLFVGADHYYEYAVGRYSVLPTIGMLFLLNFISATAIGLLLLAPIDRLLHRFGRAAFLVLTVSGIGIAGTSLIALLVSEQTKLFGFMESNYRPAIIVAIATEAAAALLLGALLVLTLRDRRSDARQTIVVVPRPEGSARLAPRSIPVNAPGASRRRARPANRLRGSVAGTGNGRAAAEVNHRPRHDRHAS